MSKEIDVQLGIALANARPVVRNHVVDLAMRVAIAEMELRAERARLDEFLKTNRKYYELREWLRLCEDSPEGHDEFYLRACAEIFGEGSLDEGQTERLGVLNAEL